MDPANLVLTGALLGAAGLWCVQTGVFFVILTIHGMKQRRRLRFFRWFSPHGYTRATFALGSERPEPIEPDDEDEDPEAG